MKVRSAFQANIGEVSPQIGFMMPMVVICSFLLFPLFHNYHYFANIIYFIIVLVIILCELGERCYEQLYNPGVCVFRGRRCFFF